MVATKVQMHGGLEPRFVRRVGGAALLFWILGGSFGSAQVLTPQSRPGTAFHVSTSGITDVGFGPLSSADQEGLSHVPTNLEVTPEIRPLVEHMRKFSPTFRRQCLRLAEASVTVSVEPGFTQLHNTTVRGAVTQIQRLNGRLIASVRLGDAQYDYSEYLAHEIEHVLEQVEGVDLPSAVAHGVHGVHPNGGPDVFETARAAAIGRLVADELKSAR